MALTKKETARREALESENTKYCSDCKRIKPLCEFHFDANSRKMAASFCLQCQRARFYKYKYGITIEGYEKLLKQQGNKCAICGTTNPGKSRVNFSVDHDHKKKKDFVRGLLCTSCNQGLGYFEDNPERLVAAAGYLLRAKSNNNFLKE